MSPSFDLTKANEALAILRARQQEIQREKATVIKARASFREFIPAAWNTVEPAIKFKPAWHIDAIADHMQAVADGQIKDLLINVPPGSAKSVIVSVMFPAWRWIDSPQWRSMYASYDASLSTRDSVRCRELLRSEWFQASFGPQWRFDRAQDEKTYYVNTEKGFRVSTSVGAKSATGWRAHATICDDPLSVGDQFSDAALEECVRWYDTVYYNRLIDMATGVHVIIMQRVGERDLSGHLLRRGGYEHLMIPMEYDPSRSRVTVTGWKDPRTAIGELMAPTVFSAEVVAETRRNLGSAAYAGQYQQSPAPDGGGILKSHLWNYWKPAGLTLPPVSVKMPDGSVDERMAVDRPDHFDIEIQSWDFAFKDLKTSDYVVGHVYGQHGARKFIVDRMRARMDLPASITAVREMTGRNPRAHDKVIEDKANGSAVIQCLKDEIPGLFAEKPEGNKVSRAAAGSVDLEAGNWYLPHPMIAPWVGNPLLPTEKGFLAEATLFPFGQNDDEVDAWSQGNKYLRKEQVGGVFGVSDVDIRVEPFDLKLIEKWPRLYGFAVNWQEAGVVWMTREPETGQHYLYAEHAGSSMDPQLLAGAVRTMGDWRGVMTAEERGRDLKDGYALASRYCKLGLKLDAIQGNPETSLVGLAEALRSGKLKVFSNLSRFLEQFRVFRRTNGKLPSYNRGCIDAAMAAWQSKDRARVVPVQPKANPMMGKGKPMSWMSG